MQSILLKQVHVERDRPITMLLFFDEVHVHVINMNAWSEDTYKLYKYQPRRALVNERLRICTTDLAQRILR